jgi:NAD-dependent deacetylase
LSQDSAQSGSETGSTAAALPEDLAKRLARARHWVVMTGSGVSAESGVPTFRDAQTGLWEQYDPLQLATPEAFARDPQLVWDWYRWRRELIAQAQPNAAHRALAALAGLKPDLSLITQNVDGLHQRAGSPEVIEFHGNIHRNKCFECEHPVPESHASARRPPACLRCGGLLRPDVVWFGEPISSAALEASYRAVESCEVFLSVGTSALVHPAASLARTALDGQALLVEVNPNTTPLSPLADYALEGSAALWLPTIASCVRQALS